LQNDDLPCDLTFLIEEVILKYLPQQKQILQQNVNKTIEVKIRTFSNDRSGSGNKSESATLPSMTSNLNI
jgi:hypothetical protein